MALVNVGVRDGVATVTLDSPHNANALSAQLVRELTEGLEFLISDEDIRAVHVRSAGKVFSSGADLREASSGDMEKAALAVVNLQRLLASAPWPVVVELRGPARAGSLGLVAAADIVLAAESVSFQLTEVRYGLAPAVISIPLIHRVSSRDLADISLTARKFDAIEAQRMGLVTLAVPDELITDAVREVIAGIVEGKPQGIGETKRLINEELVMALEHRGSEMARRSAALFSSEVAQAAIAHSLNRKVARS